ncbi:MAG TPA: 4Fe-4S dicluster domain-containing protein [Thermoanaerobaculia bacterium]|nr:4Fe-4S dicluster domain-containing protein [Thermoanaerobaculia bacterium]
MNASVEALGASPRVVEARDIPALLGVILESGYRLLGPTVRDGAIVYDEISGARDLPEGVGQEQTNGRYRMKARGDHALFGYTVGPHAWKRFLFPASLRLFGVSREKRALHVEREPDDPRPVALLGVRPCDLAAIARQDRVLLGGALADPSYRARRETALIVAVQCGSPEGNCFCASLGTGPRASSGFDLALTERIGDGRHDFVVEIGSESGARLLGRIESRPASAEDLAECRAFGRRAASAMGRALDVTGLKELLEASVESPRWEEIAGRCMSCANCTMVCPTCFCATVVDASDLAGVSAERRRQWDSCHTLDFSYIHGGSIRRSPASRYRQWMTHKLATWVDQFGETGCVGCGRCITWCPVGIDLTEEARVLKEGRPRPAA